MERQTVAGIGGVVIFADHADSLAHWYERVLGLHFTREPESHEWWCDLPGAPFSIHQSKHPLGHDRRQVAITWRVQDLDAFVEQLGEMGLSVENRQETADGDFVWVDDPEGHRVELWQEHD